MIKYIVKADIKEQPAKDYLKRYEKISSTLWKKIKKNDQFFINSIKTRPTQAIVKSNDIIEFEIEYKSNVIPVNIPLNILYEDEYMLIVDKPAVMLTHPLTFESKSTLANAVMYYYRKTKQNVGCHPLYRLDRNTSGIVIFAKVPQIQQQLANNHQKLQRYYYAIVQGILTTPKGRIEAPIGRQKDSIILHEVSVNGKYAATNYELVKKYKDYSLVRLWLETGRTHQIRVHMAYINHPLLGDDLYKGPQKYILRHALHAYKIEFIHPFTKKEIVITSGLPQDMKILL